MPLPTRAASVTLLLAGLAPAAWAQAPDGAGLAGEPAFRAAEAPASGVDVGRLPIDLSRIRRGLVRQAAVRESRSGLNLEYIVEVFGKAPPINIFYREDNLTFGLAPYGSPTHREILNVITPKEFRAPVADLSALVRRSKAR
jgi:hypothetical protein